MSRESQQGTEDPRYVWLSAKQVARRYGMTVEWVYKCRDLRPYGTKFGKYLRFRLSDIHKFEEGRENARRGWTKEFLMRPDYRAILQDKPIFEVLILQRSRLPMVGRDALEEDERKYLETLADIIQSVPAGRLRFKEPKILALGALAMLNGVIRWYSQADRLSLDDVADLYFETFMHGLLK